MNDMKKSHGGMYTALFFLTGAAVGSGIALLTARKNGHDTRESLKACFGDVSGKAREYIDKGKHYVEDMQRKMKTAVDKNMESAVHS